MTSFVLRFFDFKLAHLLSEKYLYIKKSPNLLGGAIFVVEIYREFVERLVKRENFGKSCYKSDIQTVYINIV